MIKRSSEIRTGNMIFEIVTTIETSQVLLVVENPPDKGGDIRDGASIPVSEDPWIRAWQPTPRFLLGESIGLKRSLSGLQSMGSQRWT